MVATGQTHPYDEEGYGWADFLPQDMDNADKRKLNNYLVAADGRIWKYQYMPQLLSFYIGYETYYEII